MADKAGEEALAKKRWMAIQMLRISGAILVALGLAIANGALDWPDWTAYLLIGIGMFDVFLFPIILSRRWSTNKVK
ncbi:hypothetical protein [Aurantiacibacter sediminis]|uniref:DUF2892 domain-containing protein n=1 Tax=Aurantiacibacter sediminis TaxID=2793064 RepID=A0ABS0N6J2_9SPHN|nr:hypothetical protein [Aurantiacibacter sediminis]MBH5323380.1 hypothetical protein [Aurantiacibacter sediminis]